MTESDFTISHMDADGVVEIAVEPKVKASPDPKEDRSPLLRSRNSLSRRSLERRRYRLNNRSTRHYNTVSRKQYRRIKYFSQIMKGENFEGVEQIGVVNFLPHLKNTRY